MMCEICSLKHEECEICLEICAEKFWSCDLTNPEIHLGRLAEELLLGQFAASRGFAC